MRLICPNCGAQYEVPADAIPPGGRDVQCSNCAHTWLEMPGGSEAAEAGRTDDTLAGDISTTETETPVAPVTEPAAVAGSVEHASEITVDDRSEAEPDAPEPTDPHPSDAAADPEEEPAPDDPEASPAPDDPAATSAPEPSSAAATLDAVASLVADDANGVPRPSDRPMRAPDLTKPERTESPREAAVSAKAPVRQPLSPTVTEILREEAAREEAARRGAGASGVESQADLDLDRPVDREEQLAEEARRRMARIRGEQAPTTAAPVTLTSGARSDLLPDIEEISSSLRSSADRAATEDPGEEPEVQEQRQRRGFRFGFFVAVLIFGVLALIYTFAPRIVQLVPQAEPALASYVSTVDRGRLWLDAQVQSWLAESDAAEDAATN